MLARACEKVLEAASLQSLFQVLFKSQSSEVNFVTLHRVCQNGVEGAVNVVRSLRGEGI